MLSFVGPLSKVQVAQKLVFLERASDAQFKEQDQVLERQSTVLPQERPSPTNGLERCWS